MSGNDVVRIDPEDPQAKPGTYYVGVLGVKNDSRYVIEVSIEQRLVNPPPVPSYQPPKGFALIRREVHRSDLRLNRVANGASLLSFLPEELSRGGHKHAEVKAVGHEVRRDHSLCSHRLTFKITHMVLVSAECARIPT